MPRSAKPRRKGKDDTPSPKPLMDKLGVKPGMRVVALNVDDRSFWRELAARTENIAETLSPAEKDADIIFYGAVLPGDLRRLRELQRHIKRNGAIWIVRPKGKDIELTEADVMALAKSAGLVDVKVVAFSATHTAEKLVIPLALR